jgi:CheY-like chemotaxis protein
VRKCVLIVEDQEDNALIYETMLRHVGYEVLIAADGLSGLEAIRRHRPALVLLDISLPKLSGFEVAALVRQDPELAEVRLIALTALAFAADRERAGSLGFEAYLAKPIEPRAVLEAVKQHIGDPIELRAV